MRLDPANAALVNSAFAQTILERAADIIADGQPEVKYPDAYTALVQARDEFLAQESKSRRKDRTYGFQSLTMDLSASSNNATRNTPRSGA